LPAPATKVAKVGARGGSGGSSAGATKASTSTEKRTRTFRLAARWAAAVTASRRSDSTLSFAWVDAKWKVKSSSSRVAGSAWRIQRE
jgi:hypothetical protein